MRRRVNVGNDFEAEIRLLDAEKSHRVEIVKAWIAAALVGAAILMLLGAALIGLVSGSYAALSSVWAVVAAPLGAVVTHYYGSRKSNGSNV